MKTAFTMTNLHRSLGKLALLAGVCTIALIPQSGRAIDSSCSVMNVCQTSVAEDLTGALGQVTNLSSLNGLAAGGLANMDLGQMLQQMMTQMVSQVTSQLLQQVMGNLGGQDLGGALGSISGMSGLTDTGLTSSFGNISGGIQGAIVNAAASIGASMITEAISGGISGGSSSNSNNIGGTTTVASDTGTQLGSLASATASVDTTSIKYQSGYEDAQNGVFDPRFVGDTNYQAGQAQYQWDVQNGSRTI
jgi:hypothetical protein